MNYEHDVKTLLTIGENIVIEFKRAGNGPEHDTYESICAFLNRQGGDVLLGVTDDGKVIGLPPKAASSMVRQIVNVMNDPNLWEPHIAVYPEIVVYRGKTIIRIQVPTGPDVYRFKGKCYDRVNDADVVVRGTVPIADMFIRKREIYTERRVYPFVTKEELRLDLLPRIRIMAQTAHDGTHPWSDADDDAILRSAKLLGQDPATGKEGFNAAAVLLLGKDETIGNYFPAYKTDALLRRVNVDRYDDRVTVYTNLIEAFDRLMEFGEKHLDDKFYLEGTTRVSIRNKILREMIGNTLAHREFTSALTARFIIEREQMFTENANKAINPGIITPSNLRPYSKNPIIANFFHQIGRADELGSGVRNLYHYVKLYSGADPIFDERDIFRLTVPLNADYSPEKGLATTQQTTLKTTQQTTLKTTRKTTTRKGTTRKGTTRKETTRKGTTRKIVEERLRELIGRSPTMSLPELASELEMTTDGVYYHINALKKAGKLRRIGGRKSGHWEFVPLSEQLENR